MSFEHRHENKNCSACPNDQHKHLTYDMGHGTCNRWHATCDMLHNYKYSLLSLHMKTKVVQNFQTFIHSWFPAFVWHSDIFTHRILVTVSQHVTALPVGFLLLFWALSLQVYGGPALLANTELARATRTYLVDHLLVANLVSIRRQVLSPYVKFLCVVRSTTWRNRRHIWTHLWWDRWK